MLDLVNKFEDFIAYLPRIHKKVYAGCPDLEELSMTASQYNTLHVLSLKEEWRMTDLSSRLHVSAGSLTTMMNRLIELDLVSRSRNSMDRRVVTVKLSEEGKRILSEGRSHMRATMAALLATLSPEDRNTFESCLENLNAIMDKLL